jgi:hypothetical protein
MNCLSTLSYSENIYILLSKCVRESFFYRSQLLAGLLQDKQIAKLGGSWYVQNISTFLNTFAIVSPLICVFWIQLTWINAVFSRIALVSCFGAEIWFSGKIPENNAKFLFYQKTHGARRRDAEGLWGRLTTRGCGLGLAAPTYGEATPAASSSPPFAYTYPSTWNYRGWGHFSQIDFRCAATIKNRDSKPETLFWHPAGTGIWRRSSSPLSSTSPHQPSMTPPSLCE